MLGFEQAPEWAEMIRRLFFSDAPEQIVPPGIILASDRPEWGVLRGEILWDVFLNVAALAANFSFIGIQQATVERCDVVEGVLFTNPSGAAINLRFNVVSGAFAGQAALGTRDLRGRIPTGQSIKGTQGGDPLAGVPSNGIPIPANTSLYVPFPRGYIITKNSFGIGNFIIVPDVVNVGFTAVIFGYERRLREEERAASLAP